MPFILTDFSPIGSSAARGNAPQGFSYRTTDAIATVKLPGYFNQVRGILSDDDFIYVKSNEAAQRLIFVRQARIGIGAKAIVIVAPGTGGYQVSDILTVDVGSGSERIPTRLVVSKVLTGGVDEIEILDPGSYNPPPTQPQSTTGGNGNEDATFNITYGDDVDVTTFPEEMAAS